MRWIDSPTERTSAATDVLLALVAAACTAAARGAPGLDPRERLLWTILFAAAAAAALAGAAYHGLRLPGPCRARLWRAVTAALALAAAAFALLLWSAAGGGLPAGVQAALLAGAALLGSAAGGRRRGFAVLLAFQAAVLAAGAVLHAGCASAPPRPWLAAGCGASLLAGALQAARGLRVRLVWEFDHNGLFHLAQAAGLALLGVGAVRP